MNKTLIIAHRGGKEWGCLENSMKAFKKSADLDVDFIEIDIRKTRDNHIIIYHDEYINQQKISSLSFKELQLINNEIPKYKDFLEFISHTKIKVDIELKEEFYEKEIIDLTLSYLSYKQFIMKSFNAYSVKKIKQIDKNIIIGLLLDYNGKWNDLFNIFPEFKFSYYKADFISPHYLLLNKFFFYERIKIFNKKCFVWTVNEQNDIINFLKKKIDAIITDYPFMAIKERNKYLWKI